MSRTSPLGLYLHIPFCSAICNYCNFNRGLFDPAVKTRYVRALAEEITRSAAAVPEPADTIFFGGGTPSLLDPEDVHGLLAACRRAFALSAHAEVTLEANPETLSSERLEGFRAAGATRLSLGVQSFRDAELQRLSRIHTAERAVQALTLARRAGFEDVSMDLMMWLPGQTVENWLTSVDRLIALGPDHASLYLLELYPNAPLRDEMARAHWSLAPDDDAAEMYEEAMSRLEAAGYQQYEISNVARPGHQSRHNLKYWTDGEWLGFGCGAHSTRAGARWKNVPAIHEYVTRVEEARAVAVDRRDMAPEERLEDALFTGLRLTAGLDLHEIRDRYGVDVWRRYGDDLQPSLDAGLLVHEPGRLRLTRRGMLLSQEVMTAFVQVRSTLK